MLQVLQGPFKRTDMTDVYKCLCHRCKQTVYRTKTHIGKYATCGCGKRVQHGLSHTREYRYWQSRVKKHETAFPRHWQHFESFLLDLGDASPQISKIQLTKRDQALPHSVQNTHWAEASRKWHTSYETHQVINLWTVQEVLEDDQYICKCVCGVVKQLKGTTLKAGYQNSCGCAKRKRKHPREKRHLKRVRQPNKDHTWPTRR